MKKISTIAVAAALVAGSQFSLIPPAQAFSFGSFNFGDSWGDSWNEGWGNSWGDSWETNPNWTQFGNRRYADPRWSDPRWRNGSGWGNRFNGPRFNFGDGDGFHFGKRPTPRWGYAPRYVAPPPPPWAFPPYYVPPRNQPTPVAPSKPGDSPAAEK